MTRTGKAAKLLAHMPSACVHINPKDAAELGVEDGSLVSLSSAVCKDAPVIYPVKADTDMRKGEVFIPIHWSAQWVRTVNRRTLRQRGRPYIRAARVKTRGGSYRLLISLPTASSCFISKPVST